MAITLDDAKNYLRIDKDIADDETNIQVQALIDTTLVYIIECCGSNFQNDSNLVKLADLAQLKIINDLYDNRSQYLESKYSKDIIISTIFDKLASANDEVTTS